MIPNRQQSLLLFDKFGLPSLKRVHVEAVTELALLLAKKIVTKNPDINIDFKLLEAACLLHDIDKNIPSKKEERHPDSVVRVLNELGFSKVAQVTKKHSLHCILDPELMPQTWEEKLLYLADKMVKYEVIGVEHRFKLWYKENLPRAAVAQLEASYPKVKALEKEIFVLVGEPPESFIEK